MECDTYAFYYVHDFNLKNIYFSIKVKIDIHIDVQNMYSTFLNERLETKWFMASQDL